MVWCDAEAILKKRKSGSWETMQFGEAVAKMSL